MDTKGARMNELTVIGLLICALGIGLFVASVRAARKMDHDTPDLPRIEVRDDLRNLPPGSIITVSYDAVLTPEQRQALKGMIEYQVGQGVKVIVLEAGIRIDVQPSKAGSFYDPYNPGEPAREAIIGRLNEGKMSDVEIAAALADGKISINDISEAVRKAKARRRDDNRSHHEPSEPWA
jgi:hypothetical protein